MGFFIGSNKGIALSEIYGRYLILVKHCLKAMT